MTQIYLLLARERARLQQQREEYGISAPTVGNASTVQGALVRKHTYSSASALWREDADRITTCVSDI
jgi:hypothetical protein